MEAYKDASKPIAERVKDLLSRMTIAEKTRQTDMYNGSMFIGKIDSNSSKSAENSRVIPEYLQEIIGTEGIGCIHDLSPQDPRITNRIQKYCVENTRLGIPVLFSEEGLHGCGAPGSTIFPQMISMAATFNRELIKKVGEDEAAEVRSKGVHLTFSPVLEIAREPRWGRTEETFGEDTYLAGEMAYNIVKGLQGKSLADDTSIVAEPKHFAAHSVSEGGRNCAPVSMGERELRRDFLPVFKRAVADAGAKSVMCAYHAIDGVPCASNEWLLKKILREEWGFDGFVCSDLGAIRRLHSIHKTAGSEGEAILQSISAGMDMQFYDYSNELFQQKLIEMTQNGSLDIEDLDRAAGSVLRVKFMLGLFDNPYVDETLSAKRSRCPRHRETALEAARECICLLKNNGILPLKTKELKKIALIGPSVFDTRLGDYTAVTSLHKITSVAEELKKMLPEEIEILTEKGVNIVYGEMKPLSSNNLFTPDMNTRGLLGEYFNSLDMKGAPDMSRIDETIDFNFIMQVPGGKINSEEFSVRWTGNILFWHETEFAIGVSTGDYARLYINDELAAFRTDGADKKESSVSYRFKAGQAYAVRLEYTKKKGGGERIYLGKAENYENIANAVKIAKECDAAVIVCGESGDVCGESKDRRDISLPGLQSELVTAVCATGTPTVLVLMNGRPLTIKTENDASAAVVEAWYPGESGAQAVCEVLLGKCNPSGKLPISFPETVGQLPVYYNRLNDSRNIYVDGSAEPLYSFGDGLSYTKFEYSDLCVDVSGYPESGNVALRVNVTNTGALAGKESVLVFISDEFSSTLKAQIELKAFEKIMLNPGETKAMCFELGFDVFKTLGRDMVWRVEPGKFTVYAGGSLKNLLSAEFEIL